MQVFILQERKNSKYGTIVNGAQKKSAIALNSLDGINFPAWRQQSPEATARSVAHCGK